jgi:hypothetical protein
MGLTGLVFPLRYCYGPCVFRGLTSTDTMLSSIIESTLRGSLVSGFDKTSAITAKHFHPIHLLSSSFAGVCLIHDDDESVCFMRTVPGMTVTNRLLRYSVWAKSRDEPISLTDVRRLRSSHLGFMQAIQYLGFDPFSVTGNEALHMHCDVRITQK